MKKNTLHWGQRRYVKNKFIKKFRYSQAAWHDVSHLLIPFTFVKPLTAEDINKLSCAIYHKNTRGSIVGSSYGAVSRTLIFVRTFSNGKGVALVQESCGIGE